MLLPGHVKAGWVSGTGDGDGLRQGAEFEPVMAPGRFGCAIEHILAQDRRGALATDQAAFGAWCPTNAVAGGLACGERLSGRGVMSLDGTIALRCQFRRRGARPVSCTRQHHADSGDAPTLIVRASRKPG